MLPPAPDRSEAVTETEKLVVVVVVGRGSAVLVGNVVSISQEVESEPVPGLP